MSLVQIFTVLIILGIVFYLVNNVIPMVDWMRVVINSVGAILVLLWLLQVFGLMHSFPNIRLR